MDNSLDYKIWLTRSESNLKLAIKGVDDEVYFEDLCFELQQSAEKSLKAFIIYLGQEFPKTHSLALLLNMLSKSIDTDIPEKIKDVIDLTDYAVQTRYPGDYCPVDEAEYNRALEIATFVLNWVKDNIKEREKNK